MSSFTPEEEEILWNFVYHTKPWSAFSRGVITKPRQGFFLSIPFYANVSYVLTEIEREYREPCPSEIWAIVDKYRKKDGVDNKKDRLLASLSQLEKEENSLREQLRVIDEEKLKEIESKIKRVHIILATTRKNYTSEVTIHAVYETLKDAQDNLPTTHSTYGRTTEFKIQSAVVGESRDMSGYYSD
jgi:hypothetical protein